MKTTNNRTLRQAFSLAEIVVVVAIIGTLSAVAIANFSGLNNASRDTYAKELLERVNNAVHRFNDSNYQLKAHVVTDGSDASWIIQTLQYRKPVNPAVGSPYLANNWTPATSQSTSDYRLVWTGKLFKLLNPGDSGVGVKVDFDGGSLSTPYTFPSDFTMAGR